MNFRAVSAHLVPTDQTDIHQGQSQLNGYKFRPEQGEQSATPAEGRAARTCATGTCPSGLGILLSSRQGFTVQLNAFWFFFFPLRSSLKIDFFSCP